MYYSGSHQKTTAAQALIKKFGFGYRNIVGWGAFANQISRWQVAVSCCFLSQFNTRPAACHYSAALGVIYYLRDTIEDGPVYWRPHGLDIPWLPVGPIIPTRPESLTIPLYPKAYPQFEPVVFADASFNSLACMNEHRSVSGVMVMLNGTAIMATCKLQPTIALSSTEAEIRAGCAAGKLAKYLR